MNARVQKSKKKQVCESKLCGEVSWLAPNSLAHIGHVTLKHQISWKDLCTQGLLEQQDTTDKMSKFNRDKNIILSFLRLDSVA